MSDETRLFLARVWPRVKIHAVHYAVALAASSWNAGIATLVASLGLAAGAAIEDSVTALNWHEMWTAFKYGAIVNALFYLKAHPLPEKLPLGSTASPIP